MPAKKMYNYIPYIIIVFALFLNILARTSVKFSDFYVVHIYPHIVNTYGRLTSLFPFSVGEIMLYVAAFMVIDLFICGFICLFWDKIRKFYRCYIKFCLWLAAIFFLIMTTNCFILFHTSPITEFYTIGKGEEREFGREEISKLRDYIVTNANELAEKLDRDEQGYLIYEGDMGKQAIYEMKRLGEKFDRLKGFYPRPKPFLLSNFFSQQHMMGYFFPFSMEANYNARMYIVNKPVTMCHELAHVKGFLFEDEANFIAYLAGTGSDDEFFRYSAYLSVLHFVERDFLASIGNDPETYRKHPAISEFVRRDNIFLTPEAWEQVEKNAVFSTDLVREISKEVLEVNLTLNGVSDGTLSYGRVVKLLLKYYDGVF